MAISAQIVDGKVVANYTEGTNLTEKKTGTDSLDKDAFLQILVAEMQYQDPLEPSSNTDWVNQMASFTTIEELQNVGDSVEGQSVNDLVGKRVILITSTNTDGEANYVTGIVESVENTSDGRMFSIDGTLYPVDNLYSVIDEEYYNKMMNS